MAKSKKKDAMSITDAVDNLSELAELEATLEKEEAGSLVKKRISRFKELQADEREETLSAVKETFKTVHTYLKHIYSKGKEELKDRDIQRGVKAIMVLADEAAGKIAQCTTLFHHTYKEGKISEIQEYKDLKKYFKQKILQRFEEVLASEAQWEEEWGIEEEKVDIEKQGLKDLEMVKRDKAYELFYIRKDDGRPFFNRNLLRHIKLVSDFDEMIVGFEGEDPLLQINVLLDHEAQDIAEEMRESVKRELEDFYADALHHKQVPIVGLVLKMTISLMLACNPHNRLENTMGKVCTRYLKDFHRFLRAILLSSDYQKLISHGLDEVDQFTRALLQLVHAFSFAFFTHSGKKKEALDYFNDLVKRAFGTPPCLEQTEISTDNFMSEIFDIHDEVTHMLKKFPSGPLFKTLDIFQDRSKKEGFDPIHQGNTPHCLYTFSSHAFDALCIKIPCPTAHIHISKAEIVEEFKGFLRHLEGAKKGKVHLHFNLQDRTSWEEYARCEALERLQKKAEFSSQFVLVTLPQKNAFYTQGEEYLKVDQSKDFLKILKEQLISGAECGFIFSKQMDRKELFAYIDAVIPLIHINFFKKKVRLLRKERLDFIEIFYLLLKLKIIEIVQPQTVAFSCKDGVDVGARASAAFFSLLKLLSGNQKWSLKERQHLLWILCGPALAVRERLIDYQQFSRMASALSTLSTSFAKNRGKIMKALQPLFGATFLQSARAEF